MIFLIGQRLRRADNDRISGMDADRIDVFHVTDRDRRVVGIPHDFVFDLLIAPNGFLDQCLVYGRKDQGIFQDMLALFRAVGKSAAGAAKRKCRPDHDRIADILRGLQTFLLCGNSLGRKDRFSDL